MIPPKPEYSLCNQGHDLLLIENERGQEVWDCLTCIKQMKIDRKEPCDNCKAVIKAHNEGNFEGVYECEACEWQFEWGT